MRRALAVVVVLAALSRPAAGDERPPEEDLFGGEQRPSPSPAPPAAGPGRPRAGDGAEVEGEPGVERRLQGVLARTEDPLRIGGLLYLRSAAAAREHADPGDWALSMPSLTDVYLDVRPADRVRGFVLGRMFFDPAQGSSARVGGQALPGVGAAPNPQVLLDQLWIRFDVSRAVFVTAGRQHVKWGTGRFWNPTDYLHAVRRNPLSTFDERTGTFMLRAHVPWEARGWNFYGVAVFEPLVTQASSPLDVVSGTSSGLGAGADPTAGLLGRVGGGARAEIVLGGWELGVDGVAQKGMEPRLGLDLSGGLWELDVHAELSVRAGADVPLYRGSFDPAQPLAGVEAYQPSGARAALVLGGEWERKYTDEDAFTLGAEYFFNQNGYEDARLYPALLLHGAYTPFYLGRHYAGAYLRLPQPGAWNLHTFTLSLLANLSDRTGVARLDWSMTVLTYLTLEAYGQVHAGDAGGEFRFAFPALQLPAQLGGGATTAVGASVADVGLNLKMAI